MNLDDGSYQVSCAWDKLLTDIRNQKSVLRPQLMGGNVDETVRMTTRQTLTFPASLQPKLVRTRFIATTEGWKAELTWVVFISKDSLQPSPRLL